MATIGKIRVGIVGVSPNRGFASIAHIPALQALPDFEITAVCTTRQDSADAAAKHFGVPLAFSDAEKLARSYRAGDLTPVWVPDADHEALPDRMIIYQGSLLHSGIIPPGMPLSADPREGRLTANIFVRGR